MGKKWRPHITRIKSYVQNSALDAVINFGKPYQSFSGVFMSNKSVSVARDHRWSTTWPFNYVLYHEASAVPYATCVICELSQFSESE